MPSVRADTFPALVTIAPSDSDVEVRSHSPFPGTYQINTARIIVTEDRVLVAQDSVGGARVVFSEGYDASSLQRAPKKSEDSFLTTLSGKRIAFSKDETCGCGSRLRSWNPFRGSLMSNKNPTE
jgi:hypothetical protein